MPASSSRWPRRTRRPPRSSTTSTREAPRRAALPIQQVAPMMSERELTYGEAVREALAEELRRAPRVSLIAENVAEAGHPFAMLTGLVEEFGTDRISDTSISGPGYAGIVV